MSQPPPFPYHTSGPPQRAAPSPQGTPMQTTGQMPTAASQPHHHHGPVVPAASPQKYILTPNTSGWGNQQTEQAFLTAQGPVVMYTPVYYTSSAPQEVSYQVAHPHAAPPPSTVRLEAPPPQQQQQPHHHHHYAPAQHAFHSQNQQPQYHFHHHHQQQQPTVMHGALPSTAMIPNLMHGGAPVTITQQQQQQQNPGDAMAHAGHMRPQVVGNMLTPHLPGGLPPGVVSLAPTMFAPGQPQQPPSFHQPAIFPQGSVPYQLAAIPEMDPFRQPVMMAPWGGGMAEQGRMRPAVGGPVPGQRNRAQGGDRLTGTRILLPPPVDFLAYLQTWKMNHPYDRPPPKSEDRTSVTSYDYDEEEEGHVDEDGHPPRKDRARMMATYRFIMDRWVQKVNRTSEKNKGLELGPCPTYRFVVDWVRHKMHRCCRGDCIREWSSHCMQWWLQWDRKLRFPSDPGGDYVWRIAPQDVPKPTKPTTAEESAFLRDTFPPLRREGTPSSRVHVENDDDSVASDAPLKFIV